MYNKVLTKYSRYTADLGAYLHKRIKSATDLIKLFASLEKQGYTCEHHEVLNDFYGKHTVTNICGNFNGNDWLVKVYYYPTNTTDDKFCQTLIGVVY